MKTFAFCREHLTLDQYHNSCNSKQHNEHPGTTTLPPRAWGIFKTWPFSTFLTTLKAFLAANPPIDTWSSWPAAVDNESTEEGWHRTLFSETKPRQLNSKDQPHTNPLRSDTGYYNYYSLNSLSLFWLAESVQWTFEISAVTSSRCRLHYNHVKDIQCHE